jgi:inner membrane protein
MATLITHPLVPLVVAAAVGSRVVPWRLLLLGMMLSLLPDGDVVAFRLGVPYEDPFGHRGFTHSLVVAALVAAVLTPLASRLRATTVATFLFLFLSMASHAVLDAFTRQGLGVAFLWPFEDARYFFPFHPVESAPVSIRRFLEVRAGAVLRSELLWLWLPLVGVGLLAYVARVTAPARRNASPGSTPGRSPRCSGC